VPPSKEYLKYMDWRVLSLLLSLMLVVAGLQKSGASDF
jgi:di/tricarboxylate transporter